MKEKKFKGWTNYATWAVDLWLKANYSNIKCYLIEKVQNSEYYAGLNDPKTEAQRVGEEIKRLVRNNNPLTKSSLYRELVEYSLEEVNWTEIAEKILSS